MIRYDKKYNRYISRTVKNYNSKIRRLNQKYGIELPKVKISELKKDYDNRRELNYRLKELEITSRRGSERREVIGNWKGYKFEREIFVKRRRRALNNLTREINYNLSHPTKYPNFRDNYTESLIQRRKVLQVPISKLTPYQVKSSQKIAYTEAFPLKKAKIYRDNVITMMAYGIVHFQGDWTMIDGVTVSEFEVLRNALKKIPLREIDRLSMTDPIWRNFVFQYDVNANPYREGMNDDTFKTSIESLIDYLKANGYIEKGFKQFEKNETSRMYTPEQNHRSSLYDIEMARRQKKAEKYKEE